MNKEADLSDRLAVFVLVFFQGLNMVAAALWGPFVLGFLFGFEPPVYPVPLKIIATVVAVVLGLMWVVVLQAWARNAAQ